jgi:hypothetical protein
MTWTWIRRSRAARALASELHDGIILLSGWRNLQQNGIFLAGVWGGAFTMGLHDVTHIGVVWTIPSYGYSLIDANSNARPFSS